MANTMLAMLLHIPLMLLRQNIDYNYPVQQVELYALTKACTLSVCQVTLVVSDSSRVCGL